MAKASRRNQTRKISSGYTGISVSPVQRNVIDSKSVAQTFDSLKYVKNDLKWGAICAAIVFLILIISYIFLR